MRMPKISLGILFSILLLASKIIAPEMQIDSSINERYEKFSNLKNHIAIYIDEKTAESYAIWILNYSEQYLSPDFNLDLICGLFFFESSFRFDAINPDDPSFGLGQLLILTAEWIAIELKIDFPKQLALQIQFLLDPERNIQFTLFYIGFWEKKFKNPLLAISAHNGTASLESEYLLKILRIVNKKS